MVITKGIRGLARNKKHQCIAKENCNIATYPSKLIVNYQAALTSRVFQV
uniref:Uncharacterized protein n=1 Tax=Rhizophora mucronata TaxID=61149 RepID=A0A2P2Q7Y9_RHIMU